MKPSAVLFDCDGVLVDGEPAAFTLLGEDLAALGHPMTAAEMETRVLGGTLNVVADTLRGLGVPLPPDWVDDFYGRLYKRLAEGTPLIDGIEAVLDVLDAHAIPYAVASNGSARKMEISLGQHPAVYARLKGRLFSGQELGCPKPDPRLWLHAARSVGADPARAVAIDDSPTGCRGAQAAAIRCLGFAPQGDGARLAAEGAQVFRAMADLPGLIGL